MFIITPNSTANSSTPILIFLKLSLKEFVKVKQIRKPSKLSIVDV